MKLSLFYSWQSDKPKMTNFDLIQEAAQLAIDKIVSESELEVDDLPPEI